jgi:hypothetical protein
MFLNALPFSPFKTGKPAAPDPIVCQMQAPGLPVFSD